MKAFDAQNQPVLPLRGEQTLVPVTADKLKNSGLPFIGVFGLSEKGEVVEFYDFETYKANMDPMVKAIKIRKNADAEAYYVACLRNNKPSWISLGSLQRTYRESPESQPRRACELSEKLNNMDNNYTKLEYLANKAIRVVDIISGKVNQFTPDGVRVADQYRDIRVPVIEIANA